MPPTPEPATGPQRTCIGCRSVRSATALHRIVRMDDGSLAVGRTLPGRGAWLCQGSPECLDRAAKQGAFPRAFRASVPAPRIAALRAELQALGPPTTSDFVPGPPAARD